MGDARTFRYGRKPLNSAGLEFAGTRKSRFSQYTNKQHTPRAQQEQPMQTAQHTAQQMPPTQPVYQQKYAPNEVPHDKVLYPQLSPIDTIEVPVLPEDTITNELAFDVGDTLDENDEIFDDMPKSQIKRPALCGPLF